MLQLKGENLGKRQQEINEEVIKTTSQNVDFNFIKAIKEQSDVDRLYKIDIASAYKNIDYIVETLKCGDSLYISRAIKCLWLYENENSAVINPDYLHYEVFPFMSIKMKKKFLTTISMHIRDENRAEDFYKYCIKDKIYNNISIKFLISTSMQHKIEYFSSSNNVEEVKFKNIVGNNFNLAELFLANEKSKNRNTTEKVHQLRYLTKICIEKYLDLMENYTDVNTHEQNISKLGLRLSKEIISKHKDRVLNNVVLYFKKLNLDMISKHSTVEDVRHYAVVLLPSTVDEFWSMNFYTCYVQILNILPRNKVYTFLREIFLSKYENELFEMCKDFYYLQYYELLTNEEQEIWALEHLKLKNELLGPDNDYLWYQFVNYELAVQEINKYMTVCSDPYKRGEMISILIDAVKSEDELEKLLRYYYETHVNEGIYHKMSFIDNVTEKRNIFKLGTNCWDAFNKLLHSTLVYSSKAIKKYKTLIILYHIVHNKIIPKDFEDYVMKKSNAYNIIYYKQHLTSEQAKLVYQFFIDLCTSKLMNFDIRTYETRKSIIIKIIRFTLCIMQTFDKNKDDCADIIQKYIRLDPDQYDYFTGNHEFLNREKITEGQLLRLLKQDSKLVLTKVPDLLIDVLTCNWKISINNLLKKIKVYFPTDLAKDILYFCETFLLEKSGYEYAQFKAIIVAIFLLGNQDYINLFMTKYVPEVVKIPHDTIDRKLLTIQAGICAFMLYSRPHVPLEYIIRYIKGDYIHFCLPMFGFYLSNLPMPQCIKFASVLLNTPVSIHKHGLRLSFQCFGVDDLINLINNVWKNTKNVSLRMTIYKALCNKIENVNENSQRKLYKVLEMLTLDLNENDDDTVFDLLISLKLSVFRGVFLKAAWISVQSLSEQRSKNIQRKCKVLQEMISEIAIIDKEFCRTHVIDDFVCSMLNHENIGQVYQNNHLKNIIEVKWELTAKYVVYYDNDQKEKSLELIDLILKRCIEMWNLEHDGYYISRKFMFWFIDKILLSCHHKNNKTDSIAILEYIVKLLCELLFMNQIYMLYVKLKLVIISKKAIGSNESDYLHLVPENVAKDVAFEVVQFLNDLKGKKLLYSSFYSEVGSVLCNSIETMSYGTNLNKVETLKALVSSHLIEAQLPEARLLGLCILPQLEEMESENSENMWFDVIEKIQSGDDAELQAYIDESFAGYRQTKFGENNLLRAEKWQCK